jgi:hypothetical protein
VEASTENRQSAIDRDAAEHDYDMNLKAELEIELLHHKLDLLREEEIGRLIQIIERLEARNSPMSAPDTKRKCQVERSGRVLALNDTGRSEGISQAGSHMAFVQFTQPNDQPIVINTDRIVTAAPLKSIK